MRFSIELPIDKSITPVWDDPDALETLDRLVYRADDAAHEIFLRDADLVADSSWVAYARQTMQTKLKELLELARISAWTAVETKNWRIATAAEAVRALHIAETPLKVLVENSLRDGALLETAVRLLLLGGETLRQLWLEPPVPAAVEVAHAGGTGDMPSFIARECTNAQERDLPVRMIVVADSDRSAPDQPLSGKPKEIQEKAAEHQVPCVILSKREGENYLPDFYWQIETESDSVSPQQKRKISELLSMSAEKRDYYDMKGSLKKNKKIHDDYATAYHLEIFLERVKQAQDSELDAMADDLRKRDHSGDLTAILDLIEQER